MVMECVRYCAFCGARLVQKRYPGGRIEGLSMFKKRRFCNWGCARRARALQEGCSPSSGRKRAQRLFSTASCGRCGTKTGLTRHHVDGNTLNNNGSNISVLCRSCHTKEEWALGTYANRPIPTPRRNAVGQFAGAPTAPDTEGSATE